MLFGIHAKNFIREGLTNFFNARKIKSDFPEFIQAEKKTFGFRSGKCLSMLTEFYGDVILIKLVVIS